MIKRLLFCLLIAAPVGAVNQVDFNFGHGTPESHVSAGGSSDRPGSRGTNWSVDILHQNNGRVYVGLGGGYFRSGEHATSTFAATPVTTLKSNTQSAFLLSRVNLSSNPRWTPYALVGAGWVNNALMIHDAAGTALVDESHSTYGYSMGVGMDVLLTDRLLVGVEARYQDCMKRTFELTPAGQALTGQTSLDAHFTQWLVGLKAGVRY